MFEQYTDVLQKTYSALTESVSNNHVMKILTALTCTTVDMSRVN